MRQPEGGRLVEALGTLAHIIQLGVQPALAFTQPADEDTLPA